jgi:HAE1 family hydrophobic/amphiphilic exporter-1
VNICEPFVRRPVMTTLLMGGIVLFGAMAYKLLPVSDLPNVDFPTIQVQASLPGASPETMASSVATPLERQFSTISGLDSMTSTSSLGNTLITLQFSLERDLDAAAQDVQAAIASALRQLPPDMPFPPSYRKVNPADQPIMYLALTSPTLPLYLLDDYGETIIAQRISMVSGVAQVLVYGAQKYAVRVQLDPKALASKGIGIDEVAKAVSKANVNLPTGTLYGPQRAFTVQATGQLFEASAYRPIIVAYRAGKPVRLEELGRVLDSVENDKIAAWFVNQRAIILAIQRQPGTNTVRVAKAIRELLPTFEAQLPASVSMHVLYDRSESIEESVRDVQFTLVLALGLVVMVIFLFLRNLSATIIPSLAMPLSITGTFAVMYLAGFSMDNLSLMALTLSLGFVVDDAIVMLENIVRHMEMGKRPLEAALDGSREIGFTIVSMTLSLAAVFIPVLFMGGIVGRLFHEFAVTIAVAVLISGFVSLSLSPMLCSRFLRHEGSSRSRIYRATEKAFDFVLQVYGAGLRWILLHKALAMVFTGLVMVLTIYLFVAIPKGFIPSEDTGQLVAITEAPEGISFYSLVEHQKRVAAVVAEDPNIEAFMSSAGARGGIIGSNQGTLFMKLKPRAERQMSADEVVHSLRQKLMGLPGMKVYLQNPPLIRIGGRFAKSQYQFTIQSPDTNELYRWAPIFEERMKALETIVDVSSDLQLKNPEVRVLIDRDKAAALGVSAEQIEDALYSAYGSRQVSTIYAPNNDYKVIMELLPEYQRDPAALSMLYIRSTSGQLVPLEAVARIEEGVGPMSVNHSGQLPSVTFSFDLKPGVALGQAVSEIDRLARNLLPPTITTSFQGAAQAFQSSMEGLSLLLIMAVLVMYLILGILYESFIHPITILSALPFAGFGALATLMIFKTELNIYSFVGLIMLVGLVKKNGIIMIDFALEAQRTEGKSTTEAIYQACMVRFRPIMMTTMAALMGTLPIALGFGAGAGSRRPLGLAVVGGLLFSQLVTLYVTPVFFVYLDKLQRVFLGKRAVVQPKPGESFGP